MDIGGRSEKSYTVAVCLCGVFGIFGIHHFYVGRWWHGLLDLALSIGGIALLISANLFGIVLLVFDVIHTIYFMYKLIANEYRDGSGKLITHINVGEDTSKKISERTSKSIEKRLGDLSNLKEKGLIDDYDYKNKKTEILNEM